MADSQASNRLHARQGLLSHPQRRWKHCWLRRILRRPAQNAAAVDRDQRGQTETCEKNAPLIAGLFYLAVRFGFGVDAGVAPTAASVEVGGAFEPRIPSPDIEPAALLPAPPVAPAALLRTPPVPPAGAPVCADEAVLMRAKQVTKPIAEIFMVSLR
jgi:hypothetical protein